MLKIIRENKAVVRFLLLFGGIYLGLALLYKLYLIYGISDKYYPELATFLVAEQSRTLVEAFGYASSAYPHPFATGIALDIYGDTIVRIIEGCNGVSVIILFIAFVFAFGTRLKPAFLFSLAGAAIIHVLNVLRIALLTIGIYEYPEYEVFLHDIVFPGIIYGTVFLLWFIWVNRFVKSPKK